ncbi:MAG: hypothetical protein WBN55_11410 [Eudoraea sp.]|uniref:hypothetical protein n=1 Tax=Eudoraea sp. TaxID=1979955 RepID=UPI003C76C7F8
MKLLISICYSLLFLMCINLQAQGLYQKGTITFKNGKSAEAYVQIDYRYPQRFQNSITYITPSTYAKFLKKGKIKGKKKIKLKPKEIEGFHLDNGQIFKTVSYADITGKAIKMMPKKLCLEQLSSGEIDLYRLYSRTTGKISYETADYVRKGGQELIDYIQDNFQLLIQKESKNPRNIMHINLLNFIGDKHDIRDNYDTNYYGLRNQFTESQKEGKLVNKKFAASFVKMIDDYNQHTLTGL